MSNNSEFAASSRRNRNRASRVQSESHDLPRSLHVQLHSLARQAMRRERSDHTLQPSALLNEAWIILQQQQNLDPARRAHYLAAAATTMRRVLIDHAKTKRWLNVEGRTTSSCRWTPPEKSPTRRRRESLPPIDLLALDEALRDLARLHERAARVVELRFFGGLTIRQAAEELGISLRTGQVDWQFAKAWLYRVLDDAG